MNDVAKQRSVARARILEAEGASKPELIERLADAERVIDDIAQLVLAVAVPPRTDVPPGELVPMVRALFASGQKLAIENAQLRALLKGIL